MRMQLLAVLAVLGIAVAHAATPSKVVLNVANMTCPSCRVTIEKALGRVPGVTSTTVDTKAGTVTVGFDADRTTVPVLTRTITDAGFPASSGPKHG